VHDSVAVQVLDGDTDLVGELFHSVFSELEIAVLDIIKQILPLHVLQHNVVEI